MSCVTRRSSWCAPPTPTARRSRPICWPRSTAEGQPRDAARVDDREGLLALPQQRRRLQRARLAARAWASWSRSTAASIALKDRAEPCRVAVSIDDADRLVELARALGERLYLFKALKGTQTMAAFACYSDRHSIFRVPGKASKGDMA